MSLFTPEQEARITADFYRISLERHRILIGNALGNGSTIISDDKEDEHDGSQHI